MNDILIFIIIGVFVISNIICFALGYLSARLSKNRALEGIYTERINTLRSRLRTRNLIIRHLSKQGAAMPDHRDQFKALREYLGKEWPRSTLPKSKKAIKEDN